MLNLGKLRSITFGIVATGKAVSIDLELRLFLHYDSSVRKIRVVWGVAIGLLSTHD